MVEHVANGSKVQCKTFQLNRTNKLNVKCISEIAMYKDARPFDANVALNRNNNEKMLHLMFIANSANIAPSTISYAAENP